MADNNDQSDIQFFVPNTTSQVSVGQLPIRGEKRLIPKYINASTAQGSIPEVSLNESGLVPNHPDFFTSLAKKAFTEFVLIRLPHRGVDPNGNIDQDSPAYFRFRINPTSCTISRETVDSEAFTRAGWKFGVWGEDVLRITLQGSTPGQYFTAGLTDQFEEFSLSFRNFIQLSTIVENNGYWFEGEQAGSGPLAADFTRRRIKMHQDVELTVGDFVWFGMFESMELNQDASSPFVQSFSISFIAWKERYRRGSPYFNRIANDVERGHSYGAYSTYGAQKLAQDKATLEGVSKVLNLFPDPANPVLDDSTTFIGPVPPPPNPPALTIISPFSLNLDSYDMNPDHITQAPIVLDAYFNK
jgi:hypothetical protein